MFGRLFLYFCAPDIFITVETIYNVCNMSSFESLKDGEGETIENTLRRSVEMTERYGKELPPPNPELAVVTVIPAYNELNNDNFWRMLRSVSIQSAKKTNFEVLYVINEQETRLGRIKDAIRSSENSKTVQILEALERCEEGDQNESSVAEALNELKSLRLSEWEQGVFREVAQRKAAIHPIFFHYQKDDHEPHRRFFPQGMARDIGASIALDRLDSMGKLDESIIDFVDADCFFPADYFSQLEKHSSDPYVQKILMPVSPDIPESIESIKDPARQLPQLLKYLKLSFIKARYRYLVPGTAMFIDSGPGLAVQAKTFAKVGGYPSKTSLFSFEDIEFAEKVRAAGEKRRPEKMRKLIRSCFIFPSGKREQVLMGRYIGSYRMEKSPPIWKVSMRR